MCVTVCVCVFVASPLVAQSTMRSQVSEDSRRGCSNAATCLSFSSHLSSDQTRFHRAPASRSRLLVKALTDLPGGVTLRHVGKQHAEKTESFWMARSVTNVHHMLQKLGRTSDFQGWCWSGLIAQAVRAAHVKSRRPAESCTCSQFRMNYSHDEVFLNQVKSLDEADEESKVLCVCVCVSSTLHLHSSSSQ